MNDVRTCEIKGCGRNLYARGWCNNHWRRWKLYGDPVGTPRKVTLEERFWAKVDKTLSECWVWTAYIGPDGYGRFFYSSNRTREAHQVAYELAVGPVPNGLQLDHTCHTNDESCAAGTECLHRRCVNPAHLEPVTHLENSRRGRHPGSTGNRLRRDKGHCRNGHEFTPENTRINRTGGRSCKQCNSDASRRYKDRKKASQ